MKRTGSTFALLIALLLLVRSASAQESTNRPANWATPVTVTGISNCFQITTNLYRGAQPTAAGMKQLKAMGVKTVINLRSFHSDKDELTGTGLKSIHFEVKPWHAEEEDVVKFLKAATDTNNCPIFVHCQRGADRTGMMCAMYRITVCGWTKAQALDEMEHGGFDFNPTWQNIISFIEKADIDKLKRSAGLTTKQKSEAK